VWCMSFDDWSPVLAEEPYAFIGGGGVGGDGRVWLTYGYGFDSSRPTTVLGTLAWDAATCTRSEPVQTSLPLYSLDILPR